MTKKELDHVKDVIESEGFEYALVHYTSFPEVKDKKFHALRKSFVDAYMDLFDYIEGS